MTEEMRDAIGEAKRHGAGLKVALDKIFELRAKGEKPDGACMDHIESTVEDLAMHEALADNVEPIDEDDE